MGGKTTVQAPQPSAQEQALQQEQVNLLRDQRAQTQAMIQQQNLVAPYLYKQMGLSPKLDAAGNITGFNEMPEDPNAAMLKQLQTTTLQSALAEANDPTSREINTMLKGRTLAALKGDLPVDPGLERQLKEGRSTLEETLRKQVGSGYATSTPGIEALANFDKRATELRTAAQTGQLTLAEQLQGARSATEMNRFQSPLAGMELGDRLRSSNMAGVMGVNAMPGQGAAALGQVAQGFGSPLSWYGNQRNMQFQANAQNAQNSGGFMGSLGSLFGTGLMAYAMNPAAFSDRRLKSRIRKVGKLRSGLSIYRYRIFGVDEIGVIADEAAALFPNAVRVVAPGFQVVDYNQIY